MLAGLLALLVLTNRADAVLRDPDRLFGLALATLLVLLPAGLILLRKRAFGAPPAGGAAAGAPHSAGRRRRPSTWGRAAAPGPAGRLLWSLAAFALLTAAVGYPLQRDYLENRFGPRSGIPGLDLDPAYRWARGVEDARIGLAGTTAGFLQYGFYGTDLSNRVVYLGEKAPHGAFNAIPDCAGFRAAVNAAELDYLVTSPFLNFIHTDEPVSSPEAGWLRGDPAATPIRRNGPVTIWKLNRKLDASACGPANAPLRRIPDTPKGQSQ